MGVTVDNDVVRVGGLASVQVAALIGRALDYRDSYLLEEIERGWIVQLNVGDARRVARSLLEELDLDLWHLTVEPYRARCGRWTHRIIVLHERRRGLTDRQPYGPDVRVVPA